MRTFIAIEVPADIKREMAKVQDRLMQSGVEAGWVRPEGIHLTLKFLGEVEEARQEELLRSLRAAAAGTGAFEIEVKGIGTFPGSRNPRVVWLGVTGEVERLSALHRAIDDAMAGLGFPREDRAFRPHLTLGRIRQVRSRSRWEAALAELQGIALKGFTVTGVNLMKSELKPSGAVYTEQGRAELE